MIITFIKWSLIILVALVVLLILAGQLGLLRGTAPADLGVKDGKLKAPAKSPNSVSSQADLWPESQQLAYARIPPLKLQGTGAQTLAKIKAVVEAMPRAQIVQSSNDYLYVTFTTTLLKFTDDAEFWFDPVNQVIQVRSASRLGEKDFGINAGRVASIRAALARP